MNILQHSLTPQITPLETRKYFRYPLSIDICNINPVQASIDNQPTSTTEDNIHVEELLEFRDYTISDPQYYLPSTELFEPYKKNQTSIGDAALPPLTVLETGAFLPNHFPPSQALNDYYFDIDTQRTVQPVLDTRLQQFMALETGGFLLDHFPVPKAPSQALNNDHFPVDTQQPVQPVPDCTIPPSLKGALPQNRGAKRNQTAGKRFQCTSCGSHYKQPQGLNRHKRDNHKSKERCDVCLDFMWRGGRLYTYKKHVLKKHESLYDQIFK
ncbi:hypothetical protein B0F90DRAFT_1671561 [Multifurca ochricompacta]|uniref:C2H2-type domain-containing protein n=1 Tax=Multifurca ochricompacta TaxID=376703 RepID=A0AAD4LXA3_9AGAM|nr:hypothetical protein B0F90DRAFT_1671561 [Multifurca ochricompacta]